MGAVGGLDLLLNVLIIPNSCIALCWLMMYRVSDSIISLGLGFVWSVVVRGGNILRGLVGGGDGVREES